MKFSMHVRAATLIVALLANAVAASPGYAQSADTPPAAPATVPTQAPARTFYTSRDAVLFGGSLVAALIMSRADQRIADQLASIGEHNHWYHEIAKYGQSVGGAVPIVLSSGMFVVGKIAHQRRLADLGKWGVEAAALSTATTWFIKGITGRARPYAAAGDVASYKFGRGFKNDAYASFPSGHTTAAFAMAAVLARGTADRSPRTHLIVTSLAFTTATIIGISRIYANQHWPSDVVVGAAVGTISGFAVVRASGLAHSDSTKSALAYIRNHATIAPLPRGGMMLAFSVR